MTLDHQASQQHEEKASAKSNHQSDETNQVLESGKSPPKETIEQAFSQLPKGSFQESHAELRKNFRTRVSGELAKGLWYLLGSVVVLHIGAAIGFSWRLIDPSTPGDRDRTERIEMAISTVGDAAKTLYAVLTPLATAVTGYYFTTGGDSNLGDNSEADKDH